MLLTKNLIGGVKIVCPVCVVDGFVIASCRFLGVPDPVTSYFIGVITLSLAIITLKWLKDKLLLDKTPKGSLLFILAVYSVITLISMRMLGMF